MKTIILAGGKSSRMGQNKALLKLGGRQIIDRLIDEFAPVSKEVIVITNEPVSIQPSTAIRVLADAECVKGAGPLAGIYTGLRAAGEGPCLLVACDLPFASRSFGLWLIEELQTSGRNAVIPFHQDQLHPLFGAYDAGVANLAKETLQSGRHAVRAFLDELTVNMVTLENAPLHVQATGADSLLNMNTLEEYEQAKRLLEKRERRDLI